MNDTLIPLPTPAGYESALAADPQLRSPHTRSAYRAQLGYFDAYRDGRPLSVTLVKAYLAHLQELGKSPASVKQALAAIRWLARYAVDVAYDTRPQEEAEGIESALLRVVAIPDPKNPAPPPTGRHISLEEVLLLLAACDDGTPAGVRDGAMIAFMHGTGARVDEVCNIRLDEVKYLTPEKAAVTLSKAKGGKKRTVTIHPPPVGPGHNLDRITRSQGRVLVYTPREERDPPHR